MYLKHDKFTKEELDIINRGKEGKLQNLDELKYYYYYLSRFRKEYVRELSSNIRNENFFSIYIFGYICCGILPFAVGAVSLFCENIPLASIFGGIAFCGISVPELISYVKARNAYRNECLELENLIEEGTEQLRRQREKEEEKKKEEEIINSKKDHFISMITQDIDIVLSSKYDGYEKEYTALQSLASRYLQLKKLMKTASSTEVLATYTDLNTILLGIEKTILQKAKIKETQDLSMQELQSVVESHGIQMPLELMSSEDLMEYLPATGEAILKLHNTRPL